MIKELQKVIPNRVIIEKTLEETDTKQKNIKITEKKPYNDQRTIAHKNKIELIKKVRAEYERTNKIRATARLFKINKDTVKRYISMKNIKEESMYDSSTRTSKLDSYKNLILEIYSTYGKVTEVQRHLIKEGIEVKYTTLNCFINKHKGQYEAKAATEDSLKTKK